MITGLNSAAQILHKMIPNTTAYFKKNFKNIESTRRLRGLSYGVNFRVLQVTFFELFLSIFPLIFTLIPQFVIFHWYFTRTPKTIFVGPFQ